LLDLASAPQLDQIVPDLADFPALDHLPLTKPEKTFARMLQQHHAGRGGKHGADKLKRKRLIRRAHGHGLLVDRRLERPPGGGKQRPRHDVVQGVRRERAHRGEIDVDRRRCCRVDRGGGDRRRQRHAFRHFQGHNTSETGRNGQPGHYRSRITGHASSSLRDR
jgi:hypothetical protein